MSLLTSVFVVLTVSATVSYLFVTYRTMPATGLEGSVTPGISLAPPTTVFPSDSSNDDLRQPSPATELRSLQRSGNTTRRRDSDAGVRHRRREPSPPGIAGVL